MSELSKQGFSTKAVHAGVVPDPSTGAIMTPIYATSTYVQASPGKHKGYEYSRTGNPTRRALEQSLAALEGGQFGFALSSGCTGVDLCMHLLQQGDHVISVDDVYGGTARLFRTVWAHHGLDFDFVDLANQALGDFIKPNTKMVWIESPTNPMLKIIDIRKVVETAAKHQARPLVVVDNTFATPYFQQPLALGADIVLHSTTKYLNGHSDVVGGALVTNDDKLAARLAHLHNSQGGVQGPFDSWLVLRGIKTLALRMAQHEKSALEIAKRLEAHPQVEKVIFPGLSSHPQHEVAKKQMTGFGGMITFFIRGNLDNSRRFLEQLRLFGLAESLGGVESLAEHPAIMTHASVPAETRAKLGISDTLVRLSVGIENLEDLWVDLDSALKASA
ncbi:MAG: PLP-dependent aspartate aminotransferase family protein [Bdellovibrionota bacterium]